MTPRQISQADCGGRSSHGWWRAARDRNHSMHSHSTQRHKLSEGSTIFIHVHTVCRDGKSTSTCNAHGEKFASTSLRKKPLVDLEKMSSTCERLSVVYILLLFQQTSTPASQCEFHGFRRRKVTENN